MAPNGRCSNQGISNRDGVPLPQRPRQPGDMRGHRHAGQQSKQFNNLSFLTGSQAGTSKQLTFRYDRDGRSHAATFHVTQKTIGGRLTAQVIDQDIRIDEIFGQLSSLTCQSRFPLPSESSLIRRAFWQAASQQPRCSGDDAHAAGTSDVPSGLQRSDDPFDRLQLVFESLDLVYHTEAFHQAPPASLAGTWVPTPRLAGRIRYSDISRFSSCNSKRSIASRHRQGDLGTGLSIVHGTTVEIELPTSS